MNWKWILWKMIHFEFELCIGITQKLGKQQQHLMYSWKLENYSQEHLMGKMKVWSQIRSKDEMNAYQYDLIQRTCLIGA